MTCRCRTASSRAPTPSAASRCSGVGPRQVGNDGGTDAIGGSTYAIGTVEVSFPLGIPEEWGIEGAVFSDFGTVFNSGVDSVAAGHGRLQLRQQHVTVRHAVRMRRTAMSSTRPSSAPSVGAGIIWQSPFGPLRFEAAYPILKADYDETEWFRFSVGTRF